MKGLKEIWWDRYIKWCECIILKWMNLIRKTLECDVDENNIYSLTKLKF